MSYVRAPVHENILLCLLSLLHLNIEKGLKKMTNRVVTKRDMVMLYPVIHHEITKKALK